jgi:hypothetical protein
MACTADARAVADAVRDCPSVARLASWWHGEIATYLPGDRVLGVRVRPEGLEVHVVVRWPATTGAVDAQVRRAVAPLAPGCDVTVAIDDIELPPPGAPVRWESDQVSGVRE